MTAATDLERTCEHSPEHYEPRVISRTILWEGRACTICHPATRDVHSRLTELVDKHFGPRSTMKVEQLLDVLETELPKVHPPSPAWNDGDDRPLPEDEEIDAAFPTELGRHDTYQTAMRLVGAKCSKGALVALVNWLLIRAEG